jgi:hypothetical protein
MPVRLSELVNDLRWIEIPIGNEALNIAYRPNGVNIEVVSSLETLTDGNIEALCPVLVALIAEWDLLDDDGIMIPLTVPSVRTVPLPILELITQGIMDSRNAEKKAHNGTSVAGLPPAGKSVNAPIGPPSSALPDTWA